MFEQCSQNVIIENSATHCGDGFFGFAGREALGEVDPKEDLEWYKGRGNNRNELVANDFSYAVAHGIEMTFSFHNTFCENRLVGNAICGVWGGYSQDTLIQDNQFEGNGQMGYGSERGGVNIEHGRNNRIESNTFRNNACGVFLWRDDDRRLLQTPWARANRPDSADNFIAENTFVDNDLDIQLRRCDRTVLDLLAPAPSVDADEASRRTLSRVSIDGIIGGGVQRAHYPPIGKTRPVGARTSLRGRQHIIMTEWGPYDWEAPLLHLVERGSGGHVYRLLGSAAKVGDDAISVEGDLDFTRDGDRLTLAPRRKNTIVPYELAVRVGDQVLTKRSALSTLQWEVRVFDYRTDPREDLDGWHAEAKTNGVEGRLGDLDLRYAMGGPSDLSAPAFRQAALGTDHFGTIARTRFSIPPGGWQIRSLSDDGIRVWLDDTLVIDDWTWHPPKTHTYSFETPDSREISIRVEHFELDGYAVLTLDIEPQR